MDDEIENEFDRHINKLERSRPKRARYDAKEFAWMEKLRKEFDESTV